MAPTKKLKSVNRGFVPESESFPSKDEKFKQKKRKLSDMLGPQWSKHEIERFYEAYRKHGQDWKKVAGFVRSRSIKMVEALYSMNRAYLSLPEGTASVVGLIAMMTDHYNVLEGNGCEKDSEGSELMARKIQKNVKAKGLLDSSRDDSRHQSVGSTDGYLSLLKNQSDGIQLRFPVKKRTPRVPVSDTHPHKKSRVSVINADDDRILHRDSISKEAWLNPDSPCGSQTNYKKIGDSRTSHPAVRMDAISQSPVRKVKNGGFAVGEESKERSLAFNETKNGNLRWDSVDSGKSASAEYKKGKKGKKEKVQHSEAILFDDNREAYSYAENGSRSLGYDGKGTKITRSTSDGQRKKRKKLTFEADELVACDALKTLAEISSMMPDVDAEPVEDGGDPITCQDTMGKTFGNFDGALRNKKASGELKKKHISQSLKMRTAETSMGYSNKVGENECVADEEAKSADSSRQISDVSKRCKSLPRSPDVSSSNVRCTGEMEVSISSSQVNPASQVVNPTKWKSKRKKERALLQRNYAPTDCSSDGLSAPLDRMQDPKGNLLHCLSWHEVRRWCVYEWFYSAIDYPWFAKREFVDYLNHVGLGHIPKLTRVELGFIRGSLGKPRRFSERFLQEERGKLEQYRESVRAHYVRACHGEGLPTDLACPLKVGQKVVAIHPKTRECQDGSILRVDRDNYLVQFHHPDLGVELVMDIDCMPLNPVENMPEALRRQKMLLDYQYLHVPIVNEAVVSASEDNIKNSDQYLDFRSFCTAIPNHMKARPSCLSSHAKVVGNGSIKAEPASPIQSHNTAQMHLLEAHMNNMRPIPGLTEGKDGKFDQNYAFPEIPRGPVPVTDSIGVNGDVHSSNNSTYGCEESASNVAEIVERSKDKAQKMVDTAMKAVSIVKEGEDAFGKIRDALNANGKAECAINCRKSILMPSNNVRDSLPRQNPVTSCNSDPQGPELAYNGFSVQSASDASLNDVRLPSDLITSCVATLFMIQTCTDRQCPPAEVAQILDNAATSLHPCCPQNLSIYREIQLCMGRIKTQILALVPT